MAEGRGKDPMAKRIGESIHGARLAAGYATAAEFSEAIENATGINVPKDTIQRVEAGRQFPRIDQYIGMAITLDMLYDPMIVQALPPRMLAYRAASMEERDLEWRRIAPLPPMPRTI